MRWADRFDVPLTVRSGGHAYNGGVDEPERRGRRPPLAHRVALRTASPRSGRARATSTCTPGSRATASRSPRARARRSGSAGSRTAAGWGSRPRARADDRPRAQLRRRHRRRRAHRVEGDEDLYWALRGGGGSFGDRHRGAAAGPRVERAASSASGTRRRHARRRWRRGTTSRRGAGGADRDPHAHRLGRNRVRPVLGSERAVRRIVAPLARVPGASLSAGSSGYLALQRRWAGAPTAASPPPRHRPGSPRRRCTSPTGCPPPRGARSSTPGTGATLILDAYGGAIGAPPRATQRSRTARALQRPAPLLRAGRHRTRPRPPRPRADRAARQRAGVPEHADPDLTAPAAPTTAQPRAARADQDRGRPREPVPPCTGDPGRGVAALIGGSSPSCA